jgi:hypothetical protein
MLPEPIEIANNKLQSYLTVLPQLAKLVVSSMAIALFAGEQSHWCALSAASTLY